jgi:hypothetical protein
MATDDRCAAVSALERVGGDTSRISLRNQLAGGPFIPQVRRIHSEAKEARHEIADGSEKAGAAETPNDGQTTDQRKAAEHCKA